MADPTELVPENTDAALHQELDDLASKKPIQSKGLDIKTRSDWIREILSDPNPILATTPKANA